MLHQVYTGAPAKPQATVLMQEQVIGGRYRVERPLASGAMGEVWRGRDEHLHGRPCAIKAVLLAGATAEERAERAAWFAREAEVLLLLTPLELHRRQLHVFNPTTGGVRKAYGGTRSLGFKRGSLVKHPTYGVVYVGGTSKGRVSLHRLDTGARLCQNARPEQCRSLSYASWRFRPAPFLPMAKARGLLEN